LLWLYFKKRETKKTNQRKKEKKDRSFLSRFFPLFFCHHIPILNKRGKEREIEEKRESQTSFVCSWFRHRNLQKRINLNYFLTLAFAFDHLPLGEQKSLSNIGRIIFLKKI